MDCGLCRETQETFMVVVEKRDKPTLHRVILEHIEPGSVLITDEWKGNHRTIYFWIRQDL